MSKDSRDGNHGGGGAMKGNNSILKEALTLLSGWRDSETLDSGICDHCGRDCDAFNEDACNNPDCLMGATRNLLSSLNAPRNELTVTRDRDGWWRIAKDGRIIRPRKGHWNLYRTKAGAVSGLRAAISAMKA